MGSLLSRRTTAPLGIMGVFVIGILYLFMCDIMYLLVAIIVYVCIYSVGICMYSISMYDTNSVRYRLYNLYCTIFFCIIESLKEKISSVFYRPCIVVLYVRLIACGG